MQGIEGDAEAVKAAIVAARAGLVDLRRLREGVVEIETAGMLPEAEVAFLGSTAILNTLPGARCGRNG